jgi:hypothetical protein
MVESQPLEMPYKKTATWIRLQSRIMDIRTHIHYEFFDPTLIMFMVYIVAMVLIGLYAYFATKTF